MTPLRFAKMEGLGNDFVVIDARASPGSITSARARKIADRRAGIGCDQVLVIENKNPRDRGAFRYRIFNADGGATGQCGNGARCAWLFLRARGLIAAGAGALLSTGRADIFVEPARGGARAHLAAPRFAPTAIPLARRRESAVYAARVDGVSLRFAALSLGNPHAVFFCDSQGAPPGVDGGDLFAAANDAAIARWGARLNRARDFPQGVNVGFCAPAGRADAKADLSLRVFERGAGETPACGSGAAAAAVAAMRAGRVESPARVRMRGGVLRVDWDCGGGCAAITGAARLVFWGELDAGFFAARR